MKKLLLIAAVALTATFANAAACSWNVTGIAQDNSGTAYTGYKLFLCDSSVYTASILAADLVNGDYSKLSTEGFVQNTADSVRQGTTAYAKIDSTKSFGDYTAGTTESFYTLVLNGDIGSATEFMTSATVTADVPGTGKLPMTFLNASTTTGASAWTAINVPEPTSGLLLLLGMAGLALKRKVA